jgi:hypothetical protein
MPEKCPLLQLSKNPIRVSQMKVFAGDIRMADNRDYELGRPAANVRGFAALDMPA